MAFDHPAEHLSQWAAISSIAGKIGCTGETLRNWVRQAERDQGLRGGPTVSKVWRQLGREGKDVARCTVARLMRRIGLQGVVRGREVRTTVSNPAVLCPLDRVNRQCSLY